MSLKGKGRETNGSEVIQAFADGEGKRTFERGRMEIAVNKILLGDVADSSKGKQPAFKAKKEDVAFLTKELLVTKSKAEKALEEANGNLTKALTALVKA